MSKPAVHERTAGAAKEISVRDSSISSYLDEKVWLTNSFAEKCTTSIMPPGSSSIRGPQRLTILILMRSRSSGMH